MPYINPYIPNLFNRPRRVTKTDDELLQDKINELRTKGRPQDIVQPKQSIWARLAAAIPQALAVGISDNPGQALQLQFERQAQEKARLAETIENRRREQERYDRDVNMLGLQTQIEQLKEKRATEQRASELKSRQQFEAGEAEKERQFRITEGEKERLFKDSQTDKAYRKGIEELEMNAAVRTRLENLDSQNRVRESTTMLLLKQGVKYNAATTIADKIANKEALTKQEEKAFGQALSPKKGKGGTGVTLKSLQQYNKEKMDVMVSAMTHVGKVPLIDPNSGQIVRNPMTNEIQMTDAPMEVKLQEAKKAMDMFDTIHKEQYDLINNQRQPSVTNRNSKENASSVLASVDALVKAGKSVDEINSAIDQAPISDTVKRQAKERAKQKSTAKLFMGVFNKR